MICPGCDAENRPGAKFCSECGHALAPPPVPPPTRQSAEMRLVSVLFVDLVSFTTLSETRDAEDVRELLGDYFDAARAIVGRHGGTIEKFIGDAVMAVWGAPVAREDDAERAVRAALEFVDAVGALGPAVGIPQLRARAGVVTGRAAALARADEGLVVGDRVNTAARVQSTAEPGAVFVDEVTRHATSHAVRYGDTGEHAVKGKAQALRLWRAERVIGGDVGERTPGIESSFTGRDRELERLCGLLHDTLERRTAQLVALRGEAGLGKSRLRRELSRHADGLSQTLLWHTGRCLSYGEGIAYWALGQMVRQRLGIAEDAPGDETRSRLQTGLERWVTDAGDRTYIAPRLGALLGVAAPELPRAELFAGWRMFFEALAAHEPVVLVFEDMQWADAGLIAFVDQLLDVAAEHALFVLVLTRPEMSYGPEGWPAHRRGVTVIALEPLPDAAIGQLLAGLADLSDDVVERIVDRAEGVPLYAVESLRALADRGSLVERAGRLVLDGELGEFDVPAGLHSLLAARLDALAPEERAFARAMSVFGGAFPRATAAALGDVPEDRLDALLAGLVRRGVLAVRTDPRSPERGQYAFAQNLLRTVAYDSLSRHERRPRHLAAAEHLRASFPDDGEEVAELVAAHYVDAYRAAGRDPEAEMLRERAVSAVRRAGRRASAVGAPDAAERLYLTGAGLAADELERLELTWQAGAAARMSGDFEGALERFGVVLDAHLAAARPQQAARAAASMARSLISLGRPREGVRRAEQALALFGEHGPGGEIAGMKLALAGCLCFAGELDDAAGPLEQALTLAEAHALPDILVEGWGLKAVMYTDLGRPREAGLLLRAAIDLAPSHGLSHRASASQTNLAILAWEWDLAGGEALAGEAYDATRRAGKRDCESASAALLALSALAAGRWREIEPLWSALHPGARAHGHMARPLAMMHALRGDSGQAREAFAWLEDWRGSDDRRTRGDYDALAAAVALGAGDAAGALAGALTVVTELIGSIGPYCSPARLGWPVAVQAALDLDRLDDARALIALLAAEPAGRVPPYLTAHLARTRGLVAGRSSERAAAGDRAADEIQRLVDTGTSRAEDAAEVQLRDAAARFTALGHHYWLAVTRIDLAAWLSGQGRGEEAAELLDQATATLAELGAVPELARARATRADLAGERVDANLGAALRPARMRLL